MMNLCIVRLSIVSANLPKLIKEPASASGDNINFLIVNYRRL